MAKLTAGKMASHTYAVTVPALAEGCARMQPISEASFLQQVKALAYLHSWDCHHASPTQTAKGRWLTSGAVGFPDLVLCHKVKGLIFAELKSAKGRTSPAQEHWLEILHPHAECYIWRPEDLVAIEQRLASC
jgi:hypothetical protein